MSVLRQEGWKGDPRHGGFTLIELAIVLVVISLVMSGAMMSLTGLKKNADRAETAKSLEEIRESLIGFALTYGRLPCPANPDGTNDGAEDKTSTNCNRVAGILPWQTLNVKPNDAWGRWYTYHLAATLTSTGNSEWADDISRQSVFVVAGPSGNCAEIPNSASVALCTEGNLVIRDDEGAGGTVLSSGAAAVVVSHGFDGAGAFQDGTRIAVSSSANQAENSNALNDNGTVNGTPPDRTYIDRDYSDVSGNEYDDMMIWISPNLIKSKLVEAKKLP